MLIIYYQGWEHWRSVTIRYNMALLANVPSVADKISQLRLLQEVRIKISNEMKLKQKRYAEKSPKSKSP